MEYCCCGILRALNDLRRKYYIVIGHRIRFIRLRVIEFCRLVKTSEQYKHCVRLFGASIEILPFSSGYLKINHVAIVLGVFNFGIGKGANRNHVEWNSIPRIFKSWSRRVFSFICVQCTCTSLPTLFYCIQQSVNI